MGDAIIAHSYRRGVPADGDAGGGGVQHLQVGGSIRDWKIKQIEKIMNVIMTTKETRSPRLVVTAVPYSSFVSH